MKYSKEDIELIKTTTIFENSLLVLESESRKGQYIETAVLKIQGNVLNDDLIEQWINNIPRFREVFLHETLSSPYRIRLKKALVPIENIAVDSNFSVEDVWDRIDSLDLFFDVQKLPLFKVFVFRSAEISYFALVYHHILFDGTSIQLAMKSLESNSIEYGNWLPNNEKKEEFKKSEIFTPFLIETIVPPPLEVNEDSSYYRSYSTIKNMSYEAFMVHWLNFIKKASGGDTIIIGEVYSARSNNEESHRSLGYFVQTWPLIFEGEIDVTKLREVRNSQIELASENVNSIFSPGLFDHCWVVEPSIQSEIQSNFRSKPHYLLSIIIRPDRNDLEVEFCWNTNRILEFAAQEISNSFQEYLDLSNCLATIESSFEQTIDDKSGTLLHLWENSLLLNYEKIAVEDHLGNNYSYKQLDDLSTKLALQLKVNEKDRVGVHVSFSSVLPIAYLAILKRNCIYVPLDPTVSRDRINYILQDAGISLIITDLEIDCDVPILHPLSFDKGLDDLSVITEIGKPDDICYLIYTSGTTGDPKGCGITNNNLYNLFEGSKSIFELNNEDNWILAHSYGFDFSTWEIWGALVNGAKLFIPNRLQVQDTFQFHELLIEKRITILNQTPKSFYNLSLINGVDNDLALIRYVFFGGDKLDPIKLMNWKNVYPTCILINMYGITETTVHVTYRSVDNETLSNIGQPLPGYSVEICNQKGAEIPHGFLGEFYVSGRGVSKGYFNKVELTNLKFISKNGNQTYCTGDLGWKFNGDLFYLGRSDRQIKIRGHRIEIGEIENSLERLFRGIRFQLIFTKEEKLIAFYIGECAQLTREFLIEKIADFAIPSEFIHVEDFPLNQNGKLDEIALTKTYNLLQSRTSAESGEITSIIIQSIQECLSGVMDQHKSFVQNGGDSINAIRVINKLKKNGYSISLSELFSEVAIQSLSIEKIKSSVFDSVKILNEFKKDIGLAGVNEDLILPLSEAQEGILFECLCSDDNSLYLEQLEYFLPSTISFEEIKQAYIKVCINNPILNAVLVQINGQYILQYNGKPICNEMILDEKDVSDYKEADLQIGLDLFASLSRLTVIQGHDKCRLIWLHHHLILDGWSLGVFGELMVRALEGDQLLKDKSYSDFLLEYWKSTRNESAYWAERLSDKFLGPLIPLRADSVIDDNYFHCEVNVEFNSEEILSLQISEFGLMFSAWAAFTNLLFNQTEFAIGTVVSLRKETEAESMGMFIRTLPFLGEFNSSDTFVEFASSTMSQIRKDQDHQLEKINSYISANNINHLFVFENYPIKDTSFAKLKIELGTVREKTNADWTTIVYPKNGSFDIVCMCRSSAYSIDYVNNILIHFKTWLQHINFNQKLSISTEVLEKEPIIHGDTILIKSTNSFELVNWENKGIAIITDDGKKISYDDLNTRVQKLSDFLLINNVTRGCAVGLDVVSTCDFLVSVLAIWKLEAVVCSVDYRYPESRKEFIYENAKVVGVLSSESDQLTFNQLRSDFTIYDLEAAFILHTSGSTGEPKGVIQTHDCLINLIEWNAKNFQLNHNEILLQLSSFGFDASFHEILLSLKLGGTLIEIPILDRLDIHEIRSRILMHNVSLAWIPARLLNAVLDIDRGFFDQCLSLKRIVTTGEALLIGEQLRQLLIEKGVLLLNFYGPTETHVVTSLEVGRNEYGVKPPIGSVLPNCCIQLKQNEFQRSFKGASGEIWVSGNHLAIGYLNSNELTDEKFIIENKVRWYRTGDWAYRDASGYFVFMGRQDDQVKIRGFRVEPIEVEKSILEITGVNQCCILVQKEPTTYLIAALVVDDFEKDYRSVIKKTLPDYMVPEQLVLLDEIPLNTNGKVDKSKIINYLNTTVREQTTVNSNSIAFQSWKKIFGHSNFRSENDFESNGGNSILLMKLQTILAKDFQINISVKELIQHNTISLLDKLLINFTREKVFVFPDNYLLNTLQRELLIFDLASGLGLNSPYLLTFNIVLRNNLSKSDFVSAIKAVLGKYPYLTYGIDKYNEPDNAVWVNNFNDELIYDDFENNIDFSQPLMRIIWVSETNISFRWHHILLDGIGIATVINELIRALFESKNIVKVNLDKVLNPPHERLKLNIKISNDRSKYYQFFIDKEMLKQLNRVSNNQAKNTLFDLISKANNEKYFATTDVENHPGLPGMFTQFKLINISKDGEISDVIDTENSNIQVNCVLNFMYLDMHNEFVEKVISKLPEFCKYENEWQLVQGDEEIEITYISSINNSVSQSFFEKWKYLLMEKINGISDAIIIDNKEEDLFDDFDF